MKNKLNWYSKAIKENGKEKEIFFLQYLDEKPINISNFIDDEILEIQEIYNDDLVFISADEYTGRELMGVYSYTKRKVIFPFVIQEYDLHHKSGNILLLLPEDMVSTINLFELEINPEKNTVYLDKYGRIFSDDDEE